MKIFVSLLLSLSSLSLICKAQKEGGHILNSSDLSFLETMTKDVIEASRIYPGQTISRDFGPNSTGGVLIRPGGKDDYPCFWIRDYVMCLETGYVSKSEQLHMFLLTASKQCDQAWISKGGSLIPIGSIPDHIRIDDGAPIFFPGSEDEKEQGTKEWGTLPPYCDEFYFIHMVYYYVKTFQDKSILLKKVNGRRVIDRLILAFHEPPVSPASNIVFAGNEIRGVDFGFRDAITITGNLCFPSILKYRAANEIADLMDMIGFHDSGKYHRIASSIKDDIPKLFADSRGMLKASTGKSNQPDVWSTAFAVFSGVLENNEMIKACQILTESYKNGTLSYKGNIRHVLTSDDYNDSTVWQFSLAEKNTYQNGAYWGTPTGWVCYSIYQTNPGIAKKLANEFIADLKANDFRQGDTYGAPYECINKNDYKQNPLYLATVACPLIAFRRIQMAN